MKKPIFILIAGVLVVMPLITEACMMLPKEKQAKCMSECSTLPPDQQSGCMLGSNK
ncbi:hypothetical protein ACLETS_23330 [Enterobacter ludwigii]|uniref:hypothetical protein n=1 Tax=Enterobacter ludwigii TaxID=299767 RepID=UPI003977134E